MTSRGATTAGATCPACGAGTPAAARFCPACGQRLGGGVDERRVVTVLGFPTGHDDAARAVRAALAMRDIVKTAETALGDLPLHLRIGLDTGEVAAGPWSGDLRVTGPPVHTAARVQQAAEPDQILLSARTLRAARDIVEVGPARPLAVRGQGRPVEVVEVLGLSGAEPTPGPMVGREADLPREVDVSSRARRQRTQARLAAARRVRSAASAMGALALVRRLAEHERDGR